LYSSRVYGKLKIDNATRNFETISTQALIVTYLLNNDPKKERESLEWEKEFLKIATRNHSHFYISVMSERSVEDEINRESSADFFTVVLSYALMFIYVAISLGQIHPIKSRITLSFAGIFIVISSVIISMGICSLFRIKATLIIGQVIPFLILAIGVDNMYIITNSIDETDETLSITERVGLGMSKVGTSISMASLCTVLAFLLGSLTGMPAVC
jgi:Niemann-Pick C1 protein